MALTCNQRKNNNNKKKKNKNSRLVYYYTTVFKMAVDFRARHRRGGGDQTIFPVGEAPEKFTPQRIVRR